MVSLSGHSSRPNRDLVASRRRDAARRRLISKETRSEKGGDSWRVYKARIYLLG